MMGIQPMESDYAPVISGGNGRHEPTAEDIYGPKMGHMCCNCCCDTRRATIIVDSILIVLGFLDWMFEGIGIWAGETILKGTSNPDSMDPTWNEDTSEIEESEKTLASLMPLTVWAIIFACSSLYGAIKFNKWLVAVQGGFLLSRNFWVLMLVGRFNVLFLIIDVLWAYPHFAYAIEIHNGIMNQRTYVREAESCCCVTKAVIVTPGVAFADDDNIQI